MKLKIAEGLSLPLDAVTQTFAIFGKRGSGKTNGATVLVEELLRAGLPVVILDPVNAWWGLKSSFNGKGPGFPVYIFGTMPQADLPLESTAGALIADLVAKERLPLVLEMKMWGVAERARFVTDFAKRLLQVNTEPVMMVLEEADAFIPQRPAKGEEAMLGAMDRLVRWGRQSGVGCTIVTQRSAKVNKDVTTQAETLIAFRTTGPQDRDAIDTWIKFHAGEEKRDKVLSTLPTLPNGTAWVWSPEWLEVFKPVAFRRRETFDSAATPKPGQPTKAPKQLASVDLERLRTDMAATIEKAKAEDPRELRKQIAELKSGAIAADFVKCPACGKPPTRESLKQGFFLPFTCPHCRAGVLKWQHPGDSKHEPKIVEKPILKDGQLARAEKIVTSIDGAAGRFHELEDRLSLFEADLRSIAKEIRDAITSTSPRHTPVQTTAVERPSPQARRVAPAPATSRPARLVSPSSDVSIGKGERIILRAVAQYPEGASREQLTILTGYKRSSRDTYLQRLQAAGLVTQNGNGHHATDAGIATLGPDFEPLPTGSALAEYWLNRLGGGERAILQALIDVDEKWVERDAISEATEYRRSSRDTYIQRLQARRLVETERGHVRAAAALFD